MPTRHRLITAVTSAGSLSSASRSPEQHTVVVGVFHEYAGRAPIRHPRRIRPHTGFRTAGGRLNGGVHEILTALAG